MRHPLNLDYIAGFFDGEGCVSTYHNNCRRVGETRVIISRSGALGKELMLNMLEYLRGYGVNGNVTIHHQKKGCKTGYNLQISARGSVIRFLELMLPRVTMKKLVVQDTLRYFKVYPKLPKGYYFRENNHLKAKVPLDDLVAEYQSGVSVQELTAKYGYKSVNAIYLRFRKNNIPLRRLNKRDYYEEKSATIQ